MRLIDADAAKKALTGWDTDPTDEEIEYTIDRIPTIDAAPVVHAKWKLNRDGSGTCSNCKRTRSDVWDMDNWDNYCSHCGAKMDGDRDD